MKFTQTNLAGRSLPVNPRVSVAYKVEYRSCDGVITIIPGTGEVRIPTISRKEKGDFRRLMDSLIEEIGRNRVRFVNYFEPELWERTYGRITPEDARPIQEAVDGFETDYEEWHGTHPFNGMEYNGKTVNCLIGHWKPEDRPAGDS